MSLTIAHIVAADPNHVIGRGGDLPWHISADLKRFKNLTMGHILVMGRKTFESIGRPFHERRNVTFLQNKPDGTVQLVTIEERTVPDDGLHELAKRLSQQHDLGRMKIYLENAWAAKDR